METMEKKKTRSDQRGARLTGVCTVPGRWLPQRGSPATRHGDYPPPCSSAAR
jgi:hypothetical protein